MAARVDAASKLIQAPARTDYQAFETPGAMERWMPPAAMTATMMAFDFRQGGSYRMRLEYREGAGSRGKTGDNADEVQVRIITLDAGRRIEQSVTFESGDPRYSGQMRMVWTFTPAKGGTLVEVRCENVPEGIGGEDHQDGLNSTLNNLAAFAEKTIENP